LFSRAEGGFYQHILSYNSQKGAANLRHLFKSSSNDYPAGVRFSCISQVSPVYTIGVWIARNLPP
ncbi:hypothetical protein, partial [Coprococcus comes]|uniref:hypothetical protein n=1 Tax=Coprococcus comes TaxID=410072 RepID=UPI001A9B773C